MLSKARRIVTVECPAEACFTALYNHCADIKQRVMMIMWMMVMVMVMMMVMVMVFSEDNGIEACLTALYNYGTDAKQRMMILKLAFSTIKYKV